MSLYEGIHRSVAPGTRAGLEYLLVYSACFAVYVVPVVVRHLNARARRSASVQMSVMAETSRLAANCAASSFAGL
jgi:hypothetical protein